jgi:hypothetical protein
MNERHFFYTFLVAAEGLHWEIVEPNISRLGATNRKYWVTARFR